MFFRLLIFIVVASVLPARSAESSRNLQIEIHPQWNAASLIFDSLTNQLANGQRISVTRLDFLLSEFSLRRTDGVWIPITNSFAYINSREARMRFTLADVRVENYDRIKFFVGLPPAINHSTPDVFPPTHPLNPNLNGLHWNWQGGYVFLALEGNWQTKDERQSGYSFHVATDALWKSGPPWQ